MQTGELRQQMQVDHKVTLEKIINDNSHKNKYYILACAKEHETIYGVIKTTFMVLNQAQFNKLDETGGVIGTIAYCVDNEKGKLNREWILPLDRPFDAEYENQIEGIFESALKGNIQYIY